MKKLIEKVFKNKSFVSFYDDVSDSEKHYTGMINAFDETVVLISHANARGEYDGYILKRIDDIFRIDFDGKYENKIKNLYNIKKQNHKLRIDNSDEIVNHILQYAIDNRLIVRFEIDNNIIIGFIKSIFDNIIKVKQLDDYGDVLCNTIINIDEVDTISVDTDYEQDIKTLYYYKE